MNYKLKLTMPNGEVLETKPMRKDQASEIINTASRQSDNKDGFYFEYDGGEAYINAGSFQNCYFKFIEVDELIEQAQPSEPTNVGKRVKYMKVGSLQSTGVIDAETDICYIINDDSELFIRLKSLCTIIEDQPKSNERRRIIIESPK